MDQGIVEVDAYRTMSDWLALEGEDFQKIPLVYKNKSGRGVCLKISFSMLLWKGSIVIYLVKCIVSY